MHTAYRFLIGAAMALSALSTAAIAGDWAKDDKSGCKVWNPNPTGGESAVWHGACANGFAEGKGRLEWMKAGMLYETDEGEWRQGYQSGQGQQIWPTGSYKGELHQSLPHGHGVLISAAAQFEGAFLNGKPNGRGTLKNPSGVFDGQWQDGCFHDGKRRAAFGVPITSCS